MGETDFILVEAVNIYDTLTDTEQLSVIRGGSFLLKEVIEWIAAEFTDYLEPVSTGASRGLYRVVQDPESGPPIDAQLIEKLRTERNYSFLTVLVARCCAGSLVEAEQKLSAAIRFKQLAAPTVVPDVRPPEGFASTPCALEGRRARPLKGGVREIGDKKLALSDSVRIRLDYGREMRNGFYETELDRFSPQGNSTLREQLGRVQFSRDLHTLSTEPAFPLLSGKIAVLYLDGNRFGKVQSGILKEAADKVHVSEQFKAEVAALQLGAESAAQRLNEELAALKLQEELTAQRRIDESIKRQRAEFLHELLDCMLKRSGEVAEGFPLAMGRDGRTLRLETLLWGGDELMLVVPAWLGFDLLHLFYGRTWELEGRTLTHAGGLVFCSAKTPISRVQALARDLAERVKDSEEGRDNDLYDYAVLESIDYPVEPLDAFFAKRYGAFGDKSRRVPLKPIPDWLKARTRLCALLGDRCLPRRQAYRIAQAIGAHAADAAAMDRFLRPKGHPVPWADVTGRTRSSEKRSDREPDSLDRFEARLLQVVEDRQALERGIETLFELFGTDRDSPDSRTVMWLHLVELWDYLVPTVKASGAGEVAA